MTHVSDMETIIQVIKEYSDYIGVLIIPFVALIVSIKNYNIALRSDERDRRRAKLEENRRRRLIRQIEEKEKKLSQLRKERIESLTNDSLNPFEIVDSLIDAHKLDKEAKRVKKRNRTIKQSTVVGQKKKRGWLFISCPHRGKTEKTMLTYLVVEINMNVPLARSDMR